MERATHMKERGTDEQDEQRAARREGWRLVQLAQLGRDVEVLARNMRELLEDFDGDELVAIGSATLDRDQRDALLNDVCALRDAADQVGMLGGELAPREDALTLSVEAVAEAAAETLSDGSGNIALVQLAARMLHREDGFTALAEGIEADPVAHASQWGDMTIGALLCAFRDADEQATAWVCASAGVSVDALWTALDVDALARLAWALRHPDIR